MVKEYRVYLNYKEDNYVFISDTDSSDGGNLFYKTFFLMKEEAYLNLSDRLYMTKRLRLYAFLTRLHYLTISSL